MAGGGSPFASCIVSDEILLRSQLKAKFLDFLFQKMAYLMVIYENGKIIWRFVLILTIAHRAPRVEISDFWKKKF